MESTIVVSQTKKVNFINVRKATISIVLYSSKRHKTKDMNAFLEGDEP